jgi:hypothetical protein
MTICRTAEGVSVVSESEMSLIFLTPDGEINARIISEWHKIM